MITKRNKITGLFSSLVPFLLLGLLVLFACLVFWEDIVALGTEEGRLALKEYVASLGFWGWLITFLITVGQIIFAFLPGEPVEVMLGAIWGPVGGTLTCLLGILVGTAIIFLFVRWFGRPLVNLLVGEKDSRRYAFLNNPVKLELTVFILFFIPGTPKDALCYLVPLTPISPFKYFLISTIARLPSVLTSTVLGDSMLAGDYALAIAVFIFTAGISVLGIFFAHRFILRKNREAKEGQGDAHNTDTQEAQEGKANKEEP